MTTKVTIDAHAGWPVKVTQVEKQPDGEWKPMREFRVEPGAKTDFFIHSTMRVEVEELNRGWDTAKSEG